MTTDQAPDKCPFCGAAEYVYHESEIRPRGCTEFNCGTAWEAGYEHPRELQTDNCADAERERLTRERDDWKRVAEELNAFMERARSKTTHSRESLYCLRQFDALKAKEAKP